MRAHEQKLSAAHGFSLVELMIAMVLASLVGMAAYTVFSSSSRSSMAQEDVSEAQQNVRVAMDVLAKDIRSAGFGLPDPPFSLSIGGVSHSSPIAIVNSSSGPDTITLLGGSEERFWLDADQDCSNTDADFTNDCNLPDVADPTTAHAQGATTINITGDGAAALDDFFDGASFDTDRAYISINGIYYTTVTGITRVGMYATLPLSTPLDRAYRDGTPVFIIKAVRYTINTSLTGCSTANPCLTRHDLAETNEVLAQNIEDIQFAYSLQGSSSFANNASMNDVDIVAVRANILGRTRRLDLSGGTVSARQALEDRAAGAADAYRRRLLTSVVKVRNPRAGS
jgi:type IV pilus assembly protein PilW